MAPKNPRSGKPSGPSDLQGPIGRLIEFWPAIINSVKDWLQVIALLVLATYGVMLYLLFKSDRGDPIRLVSVIAMFLLFLFVVGAAVVDRRSQRLQASEAINEKDRAIQE